MNTDSPRSTWHDINENGTSWADDISQRPVGTSSLYDNTTLIGSWIEVDNSNTTASWQIHGRIINNVTMAMPHPGRLIPIVYLARS